MIKMINGNSGNIFWVADNRVDEYLAAGHRLAVIPEGPKKKPVKGRTVKK